MPDGKLLHLCISHQKGIAKEEVSSARLQVEHGMEGDAHAGDWHRQISLLAHRDIESMRAKGLILKPGAFGENLVIDGLDTAQLGIGSQLRIGSTLLELTQIGKVCHTRCAIYYSTGDCIMPRTGLFARVLEGGEIKAGLAVKVVRAIQRDTLQAAVITISDLCAAGTMKDTAGPAVADLVRDTMQAHIAASTIIPNETDVIEKTLRNYSERQIDLLFTVGGTGLSSTDITSEVARKVIDREILELPELILANNALQAQISRALAGVHRTTLIVNLPGSLRGATEDLRAILDILPHAVKTLRGDTAQPENDHEHLITPATATDYSEHRS